MALTRATVRGSDSPTAQSCVELFPLENSRKHGAERSAPVWRRTSARASCARNNPHQRSKRFRRQKRSEEHTSELQSLTNLVCRLLLEKKKQNVNDQPGQHI